MKINGWKINGWKPTAITQKSKEYDLNQTSMSMFHYKSSGVYLSNHVLWQFLRRKRTCVFEMRVVIQNIDHTNSWMLQIGKSRGHFNRWFAAKFWNWIEIKGFGVFGTCLLRISTRSWTWLNAAVSRVASFMYLIILITSETSFTIIGRCLGDELVHESLKRVHDPSSFVLTDPQIISVILWTRPQMYHSSLSESSPLYTQLFLWLRVTFQMGEFSTDPCKDLKRWYVELCRL